MNMQSIRSFLLTAAGIAFTLMAFVFTASLGLALAGIVAVLMVGSAVSARLNQKPVRATARAQSQRQLREPRIWNDGRGTIIDL
jgi:cobalamin biosynthesis protein CobD/CbiB